ncbi:alpha/beta hydrolase family protein [Streptomyces sp. SD15]
MHGIGGLRDAGQERRAWLEALAEGARNAGHSDAVSGLTQGWLAETRFADYSNLFSAPEAQGSEAEQPDNTQLEFLDALVRELIDELGRESREQGDRRALQVIEDARAQLPHPDEELQGFGAPIRVLGRVLTTLLQVPGLRKAAQWASGRPLLWHLAQVGRYLDRKEADGDGRPLDVCIRERVLQGADPDRPLVVVAHSLGTVVAFEALHDYPGQVKLLVTLGSPLATGAAVLQRVRPQPARTPASVERWLNFWDRDDIVVARPKVQQWMLPSLSGVGPVTSRVDSDGLWVHTATKYLRQSAVAGPIVEALKK